MAIIQPSKRYTYADYAQWDGEKRYELIDGTAYMLSAPSTSHQRICVSLCGQLYHFLRGKPCEVFIAPFDVRLHARGDDDDTVVQPDLVVVCDPSKLDEKGCHGAPDFVIEVLSPSSTLHDRVLKFNAYRQAGVREYWIVDPSDKTVAVFILENGQYVIQPYLAPAMVPVRVLEGAEIDLSLVFGE